MIVTDVMHKVQLVDGTFTASEASDVINSLIDVKVNFHKLHRLSMCEGDMYSDTSYDDSRLNELLQEKKDFKEVMKELRQSGKRIKINGILKVEVID